MARLFQPGELSLASLVPPGLLTDLCAYGTRMSYSDGALVQARGDARPGLSIVREGAVQIGNPGLDGSFVITSILGPGHCFGEMTLFADLPRTHDAVAKGATLIDHVSPAAYERFAEADPALTRAIMTMMARRLYALLEFADDLRRLPLRVQLAKLLLATAGEDGVTATHEELAARFGVSRVAIGTALRGLEKDRLVRRRYGRIELPDRPSLRAWIAERTMLAPV